MENKKFIEEAQELAGKHKSVDIMIESLALAYGRNLNTIDSMEKDLREAVGDPTLASKCIEEAKSRAKKYRREKYTGQWSATW